MAVIDFSYCEQEMTDLPEFPPVSKNHSDSIRKITRRSASGCALTVFRVKEALLLCFRAAVLGFDEISPGLLGATNEFNFLGRRKSVGAPSLSVRIIDLQSRLREMPVYPILFFDNPIDFSYGR